MVGSARRAWARLVTGVSAHEGDLDLVAGAERRREVRVDMSGSTRRRGEGGGLAVDRKLSRRSSRGPVVQNDMGMEILTRTKRDDRNSPSVFLLQDIQDILIGGLIRDLKVIMRICNSSFWGSELGMGYGNV